MSKAKKQTATVKINIEISEEVINRFAAKINLPNDEISDCWLWIGAKHSKNRGYGKFRLNGKVENAHKAAYIIFVGDVPMGMVLAHQCNNENCVNPYHLRPESQSENMKYCVACGRHGSQKRKSRQRLPSEIANK